jgi:hypothetical protein
MNYVATPQAAPELRELLLNRLFVPGPMTDPEMADFALYLAFQGIQVTWSKRHPGSFSAHCDLCPYAWTWREQRGEIAKRVSPPITAPVRSRTRLLPALTQTFRIGGESA